MKTTTAILDYRTRHGLTQYAAALVATMACAAPALAETYTATWEQADPQAVTYYKNQYRFDGAFSPTEKQTSDGFAQLGTTEELTRTFTAEPPAEASQIEFRVSACNALGCSDWATVRITLSRPDPDPVELTLPTAPFNLTLVAS